MVEYDNLSMAEDQWSLKQMACKPILGPSIVWDTTKQRGAFITSLVIPDSFLNRSDMFRNLGSIYNFYKSDFKIKFQVNGTKFHLGKLIATFVPVDDSQFNFYTDDSLVGLSTLPHVLIDASSSEVQELYIPFSHYYNYIYTNLSTENLTQTLGTIRITVFNGLEVGDGSSTMINVSTWLEAVDPKLHMPGHPHIWTLAKPQAGIHKSFCEIREDTLCNSTADSNVTSLSLDPRNSVDSPESILARAPSEMDLNHLKTIPSLIDDIEWQGTEAVGKRMFNYPVHPLICPTVPQGANTLVYPSMLAGISYPFSFWRGSIKFKIQIVNTCFHTGRLVVGFWPSTISPDFDFIATGNNTIIDLQDRTEAEIVVPYTAQVPWKSIYSNPRQFLSFTGAACTGFLQCYILNSLAHPDNVGHAVSINVWISGGDDYEVAVPRALNRISFPLETAAKQAGIDDKVKEKPKIKVEAKDDVKEKLNPKAGAKDDIPRDKAMVEPNPPNITLGEKKLSKSPKLTMGEDFMNLKNVLRRYQPLINFVPTSPEESTNALICQFSVSPCGDESTNMSHLRYFSQFYRFWRGSLEFKILHGIHNAEPGRMFCIHNPDLKLIKANVTSTAVDLTTVGPGFNLATDSIAVATTKSLDVRTPFYTPLNQLSVSRWSTGSFDESAGTISVYYFGGTIPSDSTMFAFVRPGPDFTLSYVLSAPHFLYKP